MSSARPASEETGLVVSAKRRQCRHATQQASAEPRDASFAPGLRRRIGHRLHVWLWRHGRSKRFPCGVPLHRLRRRVRFRQALGQRHIGNVAVLKQQFAKDAHDPPPLEWNPQ
ncbi:hypothetical protein XAC3834 [Xanthomonas citri pv. citri str. 306]|uniref:Uncharacterized protein n=1 Tax=Xanthomonas axonopodis pv. citri (strain 306) TaxID=190486 RepID=A0AAI7ZIB6_XANAC|nr:hypothetical protein XAC3834 [Xanthomonas citri pv. citri str. 306]